MSEGIDSMVKTIVVSPSGNLYGSERVLVDFLKYTSHQYTVYLPKNSLLYKEIEKLKKHQLKHFNPKSLTKLYLLIALEIIFNGVRSVYINEGGHIKYIKLLALVFTYVKFTIHIRMIYDAEESRLGHNSVSNIQLIAISKYVANKIPVKWKYKTVYDPYLFKEDLEDQNEIPYNRGSIFRVGIIGRISVTKGFLDAVLLLKQLDTNRVDNLEFIFYGSIANDKIVQSKVHELISLKHVKIKFNGFVNTSEIYNGIDCICHFCEEEGLGRVFLEAIDELKPFIGFNKGGLIEIASAFLLNDLLINKDDLWINQYIKKLNLIQSHYHETVKQIINSRRYNSPKFSMNNYLKEIEYLI